MLNVHMTSSYPSMLVNLVAAYIIHIIGKRVWLGICSLNIEFNLQNTVLRNKREGDRLTLTQLLKLRGRYTYAFH